MLRQYRLILRLLPGIVFIVSSVTKLVTIDTFEIFIYSFGFFTLNISFLIARLVIVGELLLGLLLTTGWYQKTVTRLSIAMLTLFTGFIVYMVATGNEEHCHCFGDIVEISNPLSIVKNIVLVICLLFSTPSTQLTIKHKRIAISGLLLASVAIPFTITPPAFFAKSWYEKRISYNDALLNEFIAEIPELSSGKLVVSFFGTSCKYCKLAAIKLSAISDVLDDTSHFRYVFWGDDTGVTAFFEETGSNRFKYDLVGADRFLKITNGRMPLIILLDNGQVVGKYSYAIIDDRMISLFLGK